MPSQGRTVVLGSQKYHDHSKLGKKGFISLSDSQAITQGCQGRHSRWDPEEGGIQRLWRDGLYWLSPHSLLSLLPPTTQDHPPVGGTTHCGIDSSVSISNQENAPQAQLCTGQSVYGALLNSGPFFPKGSSLCQADKNYPAPLPKLATVNV